MDLGADGKIGVLAVWLVEREVKQGKDFVIILLLHTMEMIAVVATKKFEFVPKTLVQLQPRVILSLYLIEITPA